MPRSKSSRRWLDRQLSDPYVKRAQAQGLRSRAAYKLLEIQDKDLLIRPGMRVLDLGAAPGGWSQIAARLVGPGGRVYALDKLDMDPIPGVTLLRGDFREEEVLWALRALLEGSPVDLILSDMAPNLSGAAAVDQPRAMYLAELALDLARELLKPGGALLVKVFQGAGFDQLLKALRGSFAQVLSRKPKASRPASRELYLLAKGFRGQQAAEGSSEGRDRSP
jgi:23S rRNA (uridine2552-2'-O)-methyltransferase